MTTYTPPPVRRLQGYALDPSLSQQLDTAPISRIVFAVPWSRLGIGPADEYLEVVDYDPPGGCFYAPVDLDDPVLLGQDGLPPSEGTPQFHQQMAYAVARLTIANFERALGRRALWSPQPIPDDPFDDSHFVQRLRIYPHALREANAYYSPAKKALLFGYFRASADDPGDHVPGSIVFSCLSHDIVAHETSHALLDGLHRRLNQATNPDMLALHEGFADLVALFQHFTFPEILRHQMSHTRGALQSQENLLGQLATEFGRATGLRGALRDAIGVVGDDGKWTAREPDPMMYEQTTEPHARGSILVAAVFHAFLSIYNARTADLLRLSTSGSGILPEGAIHPDLVNRLSTEASKSAQHVLTMCVRALDYCPPADLTFGEYLRALITADADVVPEDRLNYRIAFVEAFRRYGIFPRDVRAMSEENLRWRRPTEDENQLPAWLESWVLGFRRDAHEQQYAATRREIFDREREARIRMHTELDAHFKSEDGEATARFLGLKPEWGFEVHTAHFATRSVFDGTSLYQLVVQLRQSRPPRFDPPTDKPGADLSKDTICTSGGATLIADLGKGTVCYCIRKPIDSATRRARQRQFMEETQNTSLHATYFGLQGPQDAFEPFALLHRGGW